MTAITKNNPLYTITEAFLQNGKDKLIETIKILLYKQKQNIFEFIDFNDNVIYAEPLLFSYFNNKLPNLQSLESLLIGFYNTPQKATVNSDEFGRIYLPNIGWLFTDLCEQEFSFFNQNKKLLKDGIEIAYKLEKPLLIHNTKIELLCYSIPLLKNFYFNEHHEYLNVEIENISKKKLTQITNAYAFIKAFVPSHFELIEKYAQKLVVFNYDTNQRNSFADLAAHGIGFCNSYQSDYDEVFFIDDIAHQTGHVIFNTLLANLNNYIKVDKNLILEEIKLPSGQIVETRNLFVVYHAHYTYYASTMCLNACIENNAFNERQKHEAIGRIAFYINKCFKDFLIFDEDFDSEANASEYFTENGLIIYKEFKKHWLKMYKQYKDIVKVLDLSNQPYNFTYEKFAEINPINQMA